MFPEKLISEARLAANRANAAKSTGPNTEEGKKKSRLNALKHGLTGTVTIMTPEERVTHDLFIGQCIAALKPVGDFEHVHAEAVAEQAWRLKRARGVDQNIYSLSHPRLHGEPGEHDHPEIALAVSQARAFIENAKSFELLTLYEQRIQKSMERSMKTLEDLQAKRKAARQEALEEASALARLNKSKGLDYNPAHDGFVFSNEELSRYISLGDRKKEAASRQNPALLPKAA